MRFCVFENLVLGILQSIQEYGRDHLDIVSRKSESTIFRRVLNDFFIGSSIIEQSENGIVGIMDSSHFFPVAKHSFAEDVVRARDSFFRSSVREVYRIGIHGTSTSECGAVYFFARNASYLVYFSESRNDLEIIPDF